MIQYVGWFHVKNRINWIHNKTGWNEQSTRPKKLGVTSRHIISPYRGIYFHFHALLPGLVRFSFPNLGRCEATRKACSHVMSCECLWRVLFQIFWNLALWWIWALWEYSPIQPWSFTRLTLAKLRPGNERKCICTENDDGAKLDLNWLNCIASKCDLRCVRGVENTQTSWLIWSFKMFVRALHNIG